MTCPTALDNVYVGVLIVAGSPGEQRQQRTGLFIMTGLARKSGGNALLGEVSDTRRTSMMTEWRNTGANITRRPWETRLLRTPKGCLWKCLPSGCFAVTTWDGYIVPLCTHFFLCKGLDKHKAAGAGYVVHHMSSLNTAIL